MPSRFLMAIRAACFTGRSAAPLTANALIVAEPRFVVESFPGFWPESPAAPNRTAAKDTFGRTKGKVFDRLAAPKEEIPMRRFLVFVLSSLLIPVFITAQTPQRVAIRAGKLIDGKSDKPVENTLILIEGDK